MDILCNLNGTRYAIGWDNKLHTDELTVIELPIIGGTKTRFDNCTNNGLKTKNGLKALLKEACSMRKTHKCDVPVSSVVEFMHATQPLARWIHTCNREFGARSSYDESGVRDDVLDAFGV